MGLRVPQPDGERHTTGQDYFDSDFAVTEVADFDFSDPPIRSKMPDNLELITI